MNRSFRTIHALGFLTLLVLAACGGSSSPEGADVASIALDTLPPPIVAPLPEPYVAGDTAGTEALQGYVRLATTPPLDTLVRPTVNAGICGSEFVDRTTQVVQGDRLAGAIVWLANPPAGKPLSLSRRYEVTIERCQLHPRILAALAGGTVNIRSTNRLVHRIRLLNARTGEIYSVLLHNDQGQVVPVHDPLNEAGLIELRDDEHAWTRAWIAVFDHPYYAVSGRDGTFRMEHVPPGRYALHTWHERFGVTMDSITISAGADTIFEVNIGTPGVEPDSREALP